MNSLYFGQKLNKINILSLAERSSPFPPAIQILVSEVQLEWRYSFSNHAHFETIVEGFHREELAGHLRKVDPNESSSLDRFGFVRWYVDEEVSL